MISIIGAGPIGSFTAFLLAKKGFKVNIYEEHEKAGKPVQCTGIVTKELFNIIPKNQKYIVNKFDKVKIITKHNKTEIQLDEYLLDRTKFDNHLLKQAIKAGAKIHFNHKFIKQQNNKIILKHNNQLITKTTNILIGADGPLSQVAKSTNIYKKRKFFTGIQARVKGKFEKHTFTTYFGSIAPGFFAWVVPESNTVARIGIATKRNTNTHFQKLTKLLKIKQQDILEFQGGPIPIYNNNQIVQKNNTYLVGDAAGFCKNTTGGGLVTGLKSAQILANCIVHKKNYRKAIKPLQYQLKLHKLMRNLLDKFQNKHYAKLIQHMKNKKINHILNKHKRDFPIKLILKLIITKPQLLFFALLFFKKRKI